MSTKPEALQTSRGTKFRRDTTSHQPAGVVSSKQLDTQSVGQPIRLSGGFARSTICPSISWTPRERAAPERAKDRSPRAGGRSPRGGAPDYRSSALRAGPEIRRGSRKIASFPKLLLHPILHSARTAAGVLFPLRRRCPAQSRVLRTCHRTTQSGWTHCAWCGNQL